MHTSENVNVDHRQQSEGSRRTLRRLTSLSTLLLQRSQQTSFDPLHIRQRSAEARAVLQRLSQLPMPQLSQHRQRSRSTAAQHQSQQQTATGSQQQQPPEQSSLQPATARLAQMAAAATAAAAAAATATPPPAPAPAAQDDNCDADPRPWSPSGAEDYADMPQLINASPPQPSGPFTWDPPAMSPVRHFLAAPPQDSTEYPVQMDLDESEDEEAMPPLVSVDDLSMMDWLGAPSLNPWVTPPTRDPQQQQEAPAQQRQRQQHGDDERAERLQLLNERAERLQLLNGWPQLRPPPRATGPRSRPSSRRTTGPQAARAAWAPASQPAQQQDAQGGSRNRRHIDALYASAVQQVWARTARLSADLLGWGPGSGAPGARAEQQQPLLLARPNSVQQQRQQEEQQEYVQLQQVEQVPLSPSVCRAPAPCSFLQPGLSFTGSQKLLQRGSMRREDQWTVVVTLHDVDHCQGRVRGSMRAQDVAGAPGPIDTYFEGDIVDEVNNTFWTHTWGTSRETDLRHWSKFEGFASIKPLVVKHAGRCGQLHQHPTIFMRWKEQFFVNTKEECGLTIAGFYYMVLDRRTGAMRGLYYDPSSSPFQELNLQVDQGSSSGGSSRRSSSSSTADTARVSSSSGSSASSAGGGGVSFASFSFA